MREVKEERSVDEEELEERNDEEEATPRWRRILGMLWRLIVRVVKM